MNIFAKVKTTNTQEKHAFHYERRQRKKKQKIKEQRLCLYRGTSMPVA